MAAAVGVMAAGLFWPREAAPHNPITTTVLFNREVSRIFQQKCLTCHSAGALAMPLTTYEEARPWAVAIKEEILDRHMPPWPAEGGYGEFANNVGLTARERDFLISWIDGGAPKGDVEPPTYVDHGAHWMLGEPDLELAVTPGVTVDPGRAVGFTRIVIDTRLTREKWLRGFDYKPGDKRVVRAAFLGIDGTRQYLGAWTPWRSSMQAPEGVAIKLPAGAKIAVDVLYQPSSTPVVDAPKLGLYFSDTPGAREMTSTVLEPSNAVVRSSTEAAPGRLVATSGAVAGETSLFEMRPEMGPGGRSIEVKIQRPDGSSQVVLWIKKFQHDWQTSYVFRKPLVLSRGSVVQAIAYLDAPPGGAPRAEAPPFTVTFNSFAPPPPASPPRK
jgi:hypothetical protein